MLASDNEDAVPEQHQLLATPLVGEPVIVKPEVTANSSQADVASVVPGSGSVGGVYMPQPTAYYQPVQHVYQPVPEMFGLSCSMHQPMPVVPAQFLPTAAPAAEVVVREETARQEEEEEKKDQPRSRRNRVGVHELVVVEKKNNSCPTRLTIQQTAEELAANEERVKKRRRESAQRSRARKNCYVKNLEFENRSLKAENDKLRALLAQLNPGMASSPPLSCTPTGHQMLSVMVGETDGHSAAPSR